MTVNWKNICVAATFVMLAGNVHAQAPRNEQPLQPDPARHMEEMRERMREMHERRMRHGPPDRPGDQPGGPRPNAQIEPGAILREAGPGDAVEIRG